MLGRLALTVALGVCASPTLVKAAAIQTLSFSGQVSSGFNSIGPLGPASTALSGKDYSISLSYDPSAFQRDSGSNDCNPNAGNACDFYLSSSRQLTEVISVNGYTTTNVFSTGQFSLNATGGQDLIIFSINDGVRSVSGLFQDGRSFFPNQADVSSAEFNGFQNVPLSTGSFVDIEPGYQVSVKPSALSAALVQVPEPLSISILSVGVFSLLVAGQFRRLR